jgi:hypothetical protein
MIGRVTLGHVLVELCNCVIFLTCWNKEDVGLKGRMMWVLLLLYADTLVWTNMILQVSCVFLCACPLVWPTYYYFWIRHKAYLFLYAHLTAGSINVCSSNQSSMPYPFCCKPWSVCFWAWANRCFLKVLPVILWYRVNNYCVFWQAYFRDQLWGIHKAEDAKQVWRTSCICWFQGIKNKIIAPLSWFILSVLIIIINEVHSAFDKELLVYAYLRMMGAKSRFCSLCLYLVILIAHLSLRQSNLLLQKLAFCCALFYDAYL